MELLHDRRQQALHAPSAAAHLSRDELAHLSRLFLLLLICDRGKQRKIGVPADRNTNRTAVLELHRHELVPVHLRIAPRIVSLCIIEATQSDALLLRNVESLSRALAHWRK